MEALCCMEVYMYVHVFICTYVLYVRTVFHWDLFANCKVIDMYVCMHM